MRIARSTLGFLVTFATLVGFPGWIASVQAGTPNTWTTVAPVSKGLLWSAVATAAGKLYVFGGLGPTNFLATFESYDPNTNRWAKEPPLPAPRVGMGVATGPDGRVYAVGGAGYGNGTLLEAIRQGSRGGVTGR